MKTKNRSEVTKNKGIIFVVMLLTLLMVVGVASASGVTTDRLNFYDSEQHTVTISSTLGADVSSSSEMPVGFTFISSVDGCANPSGQTISCSTVPANGMATFIMSSPVSGTEYQLYDLTTTLNGTDLNNVSFINIRDDEIFHDLVEFGRGRGNYFYDSMGTATSAGTGTGYNYVPNGTAFELNFLHKIYNVKQYFGLASGSDATDVTFTCVYPYQTMVRQHLTEAIGNDGNDWTVDYSIPRIEGSWERMGFTGLDFDAGEYSVGDVFAINCSNLDYNLADAYGHIVVEEDSLDMEVRSMDALAVTASSGSTSIGNGSSEVVITYTITNNEQYPVDTLMLEISSPEEAVFVGVRGELWGASQDKYSYELPNLESGESVQLQLVARFDTSASSDTTLLLTEGVEARYVPTWELNAYNPMAYLQTMSLTDTQTVNYGVSSSITNLMDQIDRIETNTIAMNTTVNSIYTLVNEINGTTHTTSDNLLLINTSLSTLIGNVNSTLYNQADSNYNSLASDISDLSTQVTNFEATVQQLVNCTLNAGAPICVNVNNLNTSIANMQSDLLSINTTLSTQVDNVNASIMNELSTQFTSVASNFTYTNSLITSINSSINNNIDAVNTSLSGDISNLQTTVNDIETDISNLDSSLTAINTSLTTQITTSADYVIDTLSPLFNNITIDATEILTELDYMQGFNEELIFLVTDSVGLANEAKTDYENGDVESATAKLLESAEKLQSAQLQMDDAKKPVENEYNRATATNSFSKMTYWFKGLFL